MTANHLEPKAYAALLLELARALKARRFYPSTHPALREVLERATGAWRKGLDQLEEVRLEIRGATLRLPDGAIL